MRNALLDLYHGLRHQVGALVLMRGFQVQAPAQVPKAIEMGNTRLLGIEIYTQYLYPLQLAAVLLFLAVARVSRRLVVAVPVSA